MASTLHYTHVKTIQAFKHRALNLSKQDIWLPLVFDPDFARDHGPVLTIWDALSLSLEDFTNIVVNNTGFWITRSSCWANVFLQWGYEKEAVVTEGHKKFKGLKLKWANFSGRKEKPIDDFYRGESGMSLLRNGDLPNCRNCDGFVFREKRPAQNSSEVPAVSRRIASSAVVSCSSNLSSEFQTPQSSSSSAVPDGATQLLLGSLLLSPAPSFPRQLEGPADRALHAPTDLLTPALNETAVADIESGRRKASKQELALALRLIMASATADESGLHHLTVKGSTIFAFWSPRATDSDGTRKVIARRASQLQLAAGLFGAGANTISKWMRKDPELFTKANTKAKALRVMIDAATALQFQSDMNLPHNGMRTLVKFFGNHKIPVTISPENERRALLRSARVESSYYSNVRLESSKGGIVECLVYVGNVAELYIQSLDVQVENQSFKFWPLASHHGENVQIAKIAVDFGQGSDKVTVTNPNNEFPCSSRIVATCASVEAEKADQGKKPADSYPNYKFVVPRIPGMADLYLNKIVRVGSRHAIVPSRIIPTVWAEKQLAEGELAAFYDTAYGGKSGTCAERADKRQALAAESGILVFNGTKFIGIEARGEAGIATFPVREPVETAPPLAPIVPVVYRLEVHFCSDYKATATWIGKPNQSSCTCLHGCLGAKKYKAMAANPATACPLYTAQSHAADLARFQQLASNTPVNGVSKPALIVLDPERVHPPYLHLILGLVNDEAAAIATYLKSLDSTDPALTAALEAATEALGEEELVLMAHIDGATELLGRDNAFVQEIIPPNSDIGVLVGQVGIEQWQRLSEALGEAAATKSDAASKIRNPVLPAGQVRSRRQQNRDEDRAKIIDDSAKTLSEAATAVADSAASVGKARAAVKENEAALGLRADADAETPKGGVMYIEWKDSLRSQGISMEVYWNDSLVGPACRKFLDAREAILQRVRDKIASIHGQEKADDFYHRHLSVLTPLAVVSHLTRKVAMLSAQELDDLEAACAAWGSAFRAAYPNHVILTPKGHAVEKHVVFFARLYGTCGIFGEDGLEALHPMAARARLIVRSMKNSVKRHQAMSDHLAKAQLYHGK